jgi:hypothetical protein
MNEARTKMSKAGLSVFVFGFYRVIVGFGFMIAPHWNLRLFGLSAGDDVWIRRVGMLASMIGAYDLLAVRARLEVFFQWTVPGRYYAAGFMALMFVLSKVGPAIVLFAALEAVAATWTWMALRSNTRPSPPPPAAG